MQVVGRARLGAFLRCFGRPGALPGALMTVCRPVIAPSSQNRCETLITQLLTMPARALRTGGAGAVRRRRGPGGAASPFHLVATPVYSGLLPFFAMPRLRSIVELLRCLRCGRYLTIPMMEPDFRRVEPPAAPCCTCRSGRRDRLGNRREIATIQGGAMADYYGTDTVVSELREDGLLIIRINRPDVANALNGVTSKAMENIMNNAETDPAVRAIIVTGTGKVFCAGEDLSELSEGGECQTVTEHGFGGLTARLCSKPVIAACNGSAAGGGMEIALSCDMVVAAENAKFGCTEVGLGIIASTGGIVRLARDINRKDCMELLLTGKKIKAPEAQGSRPDQLRRAGRRGHGPRYRAGRRVPEERPPSPSSGRRTSCTPPTRCPKRMPCATPTPRTASWRRPPTASKARPLSSRSARRFGRASNSPFSIHSVRAGIRAAIRHVPGLRSPGTFHWRTEQDERNDRSARAGNGRAARRPDDYWGDASFALSSPRRHAPPGAGRRQLTPRSTSRRRTSCTRRPSIRSRRSRRSEQPWPFR